MKSPDTLTRNQRNAGLSPENPSKDLKQPTPKSNPPGTQTVILKKRGYLPSHTQPYIETLPNRISSPILENGVFYFFFRPRVNVEDVTSLSDVQKSYLLLRPAKSDLSHASKDIRIIQIPKKALPATSPHERFLGFVIASEESVKVLKDDIGESTYSTATRGERLQPASRPVAEGVYALVADPDGRTTHFAYVLTVPQYASVRGLLVDVPLTA